VDFNLNGFLNNVVHISGFRGEDGGIVEMNAMFLDNIVFSYDQLVQMFLSDVLLMVL
jgi:hypothetical protein